MNQATLHRTGERPILRFERHLRRPVDDVWRAVTDPDEMRAWFPTRIVIDEWKVGAALTHVFEEHDIDPLPGSVLEWIRRGASRSRGAPTRSRSSSPRRDGGTTFVLTEELGAAIAARNAAGWEVCLDRLEGRAPADGDWKPRFDRYVEQFAPILGPQEGPPPGVK